MSVFGTEEEEVPKNKKQKMVFYIICILVSHLYPIALIYIIENKKNKNKKDVL